MRFLRPGLALGLLAIMGFGTPAHAAEGVQRTWNGRQIHLYDAFAAGYDGRNVTVAVLDGWIGTGHPDFGGRIATGADCTTGSCTTHMGSDHCGQDHGTHVAGIVTSSSYGVAPRARLMPIRVLTDDGNKGCEGLPVNVANGIRWATDHGADVINASLGPDVPGSVDSSEIPSAVDYAASHGVVVVFSAGNRDIDAAQSYGDSALIVAATGPSGGLASYSQHGAGVSVAAPGGQPDSHNSCTVDTCVESVYPGDQYAVAAGTSMAAPHVAGLAALLIQKGLSRQAVIDRITGTARPLSGAGAGRIDAAAALNVPVIKPAPTPTPTHRASRPGHAVTSHATSPPSPATVSPSPRPNAPASTPTPTSTASPTPSTSPTPQVVAEVPTAARHDEVPLPLAALAGGLIGLAATALIVTSRP